MVRSFRALATKTERAQSTAELDAQHVSCLTFLLFTFCPSRAVPPNGLVMYVGTILTDEGKEKKVNFDFEPHKPINTTLYRCDNKFQTGALSELLDSDSKFGFIIMDGSGTVRRSFLPPRRMTDEISPLTCHHLTVPALWYTQR